LAAAHCARGEDRVYPGSVSRMTKPEAEQARDLVPELAINRKW
jgi:hypothetical protein